MWSVAIAPGFSTSPSVLAQSPASNAALQRAIELGARGLELYQAGRYADSILATEESLSIFRAALGDRHPDVVQTVYNLAVLYELVGRNAEAEPLYAEAVAALRARLGDRHPEVADALYGLGTVYRNQGRYREAEPLLQDAVAIWRSGGSEYAENLSLGLTGLALLYRLQGRYGEAEPIYQAVLTEVRSRRGDQHPDVAATYNNLAVLYDAQGRYGESEPLYRQALVIWRSQLGDRHPHVGTTLNNLGWLAFNQGRYTEAEEYYLQALDIRRAGLGDRHVDVAQTLNNLGVLYQNLGRFDAAEEVSQAALAIYRRQLGDRHPDVALSLNNLATLNQLQQDYAEAEPLYRQALEIYRALLGDRHPDVANSLNNLALLYANQARYREAESLYQESLNIWQEQLGDRHPDIAISFNNLSLLYAAEQNWPRTLDTLKAGLDIEEWNLALNLAVLTDEQRQNYVATLYTTTQWSFSLHLNVIPDDPEAARLALTTLLRRKGRILDAGVSSLQTLKRGLGQENAEVQRLFQEFTTVQQSLANLTFNRPAQLSAEQYQRDLKELSAIADQLEGELTRRSAVFRAETQAIDIEAVQARIPADGVLMEYVRYRPYNLAQDRYEPERYAVYLLFPDGRIQAQDLGDAAAIDAQVQQFSAALRDPTASPAVAARALSALIFEPILSHVGGVNHLLISPDSQLNRIPFEALPGEDGAYLVERYQISYLNSGRDLLKLGRTAPSRQPAVILANPDYEQASLRPQPGQLAATAFQATGGRRSTDLSQLRVGPLPGTATEAAAIAALIPTAQLFTQANATENRLKTVDAPRILHIATHGFFLTDVADEAIATNRGLGVVASNGGTVRATPITVENPLLRSGLALAGFNARHSGSEDGVLTALEAASLNLLGTQLVVLSACETGLGNISNGEGVYGLRRAFAIAGAESQLLSLWQVDDSGTQSLMSQYYQSLLRGMGRAEALRTVQLAMIQGQGEYAHPYYWAAFILTGDWQPLTE